MANDALVLFDIDGTLLRGAGSHHKDALVEGIRRVTGVTCSFEGIDTSGRLDRDLIAALLTPTGFGREKIRRSLSQIVREAQTCYQEICTVDLRTKVLPGVMGTLRELQRRGIPMGLVTGNLTAIAWRKMELAGLREFFQFGAFAEEGRSRARLAKLAVWQARRQRLVRRDCAVSLIGDHANDIAAAKLNGFRAIAVATGPMPAEELREHNPDILLNEMTQLVVESLLQTRAGSAD